MSYYSEVMADSPGVYLRLDETVAGTASAGNTIALDSSGNGRHGVLHTAQGYPAIINPSTNKIPSSTINLNRPSLTDGGSSVELGDAGQSGGHIVLPDLPLSNDYTIEFVWQPYVNTGYPPAISMGRNSYRVGPSGTVGKNYHQVELSIGAGSNTYIYLDTFTHTPTLDTETTYRRAASTILLNPSVAIGVKQHITIVRKGMGRSQLPTGPDESLVALYINGVLASGMPFGTGGFVYSNPIQDRYDLTDSYSHGSPYTPTAPPSAYAGLPPLHFYGAASLIDEIAYYPHALSEARILAHSNAKGTGLTGSPNANLRAFTASSASLVVPAKFFTPAEGRDLPRWTTTNAEVYVPVVLSGDASLGRMTTGYIANPVDGAAPETTWPEYGQPGTPSAGFDPNLASVNGINIDGRSTFVAPELTLSRMSVMGVMDIDAAEPQTRVLGKAQDRNYVYSVRWRRGTLVDPCIRLGQDAPPPGTARDWTGSWWGQANYDNRLPVAVVSGTIEATYQSYASNNLFRRVGEVDTSVEGWIGIDWRVIRADPANNGKWLSMTFVSSSGKGFGVDQSKPKTVATDPNTGALMPGWERSWYQVPAGYVSGIGFELHFNGLLDDDKVQINAVVTAQAPTETRFHPKLKVRRPEVMLTNYEADWYRYKTRAHTYDEVRIWDSFDMLYSGAREWAAPLIVKQSKRLGKAVDAHSARVLNPSADRLLVLGRASEAAISRKLSPPPALRKAAEVSRAGVLKPIFAPILLGRASEENQVFVLDKLDATLTVPVGTPELLVYAMVEDQTPVLTLTAEPAQVTQAPATIRLTVTGGLPATMVVVAFEDTILAQGMTDSDGNLYQLPVIITGDVGAVGTHTLRVTQNGTATSALAEIEISVAQAPAPIPTPPAPDVPPTPVPSDPGVTVRKWVLQDPSPGGLGSYVLPVNPREMTSPHHEHAMTTRHTTARSGRFHIFQAAMLPKEWQFGGYCPTEEMAEKLLQFRELNRRIYVIDHHGRAWKVAITHLDITPRLRHWYNGELSDWGSDWSMTVTVLDQNPVVV